MGTIDYKQRETQQLGCILSRTRVPQTTQLARPYQREGDTIVEYG